MTRKLVSLFLAAALLAAFVPAMAESGLTVTDMTGREIALDGPASKIVALTASDVEIIYALGAGDLLVGRGEYCDYPAEVLDKPVVKSGAETNLEEILALQPDVVLMATMAQTEDQVNALEQAGVRVIVSDAPTAANARSPIKLPTMAESTKR
jgi:iron complex transport system substrate-binding protein